MKSASIKSVLMLVVAGFAGITVGLAQQRKTGEKAYFTGTVQGLYVEFNDVAVARMGLTVMRKSKADADYVPVGRTARPTSGADFYRRMSDVVDLFPGYSLPATELADSLWQVWSGQDAASLLGVRSPIIHLALGLSFLDTGAVSGETYAYQFTGKADGSRFGSEWVDYERTSPAFSPMRSTIVDPGESRPYLEWQSAQANGAMQFDIWRRVSGTATDFEKLFTPSGVVVNAKGDSLTYLVTDTTALSGVRYDYYIASRDIFGNPGNPSDTVTLQVGGRRNIETAFNVQTQAVDNGIRLYWEPLEQRYSLQNIVILRSAVYDGGYETIATVPVTDTAYVDLDVRGGKSYYYQLLIQGEANFSLASPRVSGIYQGVVKLLPPQNLEGKDTPEGCRLSWYYADTVNLRGFYVYRTTSPTSPLEQVSGLLPPTAGLNTYVDTAQRAAGGHAYYMVAAVSTTQSLSPPSAVIEVLRSGTNETVRLTAPSQLRPLWLTDTTVSLTWLDLHRISEHVAVYRVYRKDTDDGAFGEKAWLETDMNEFVDTLTHGQQYWYAIRSVDASGTLSALSPVVVVASQYQKPLPPGSVRLMAGDGGVVVNWDTDGASGNIHSYRIYRALAAGGTEMIADVESVGEQQSYLDKTAKAGNRYYYYVSSVDKRGIESEVSEEVSITMP
ncbi:hypothetical protein GCM10011418_09760 [Sphingobacterium alkalisoli]|nr:hypothetical protein [Sphingobacterium alkalisoli]GGH11106.1 hypothetical protein GCM10011418_09760 [Sphingobacterium alkalisoli]